MNMLTKINTENREVALDVKKEGALRDEAITRQERRDRLWRNEASAHQARREELWASVATAVAGMDTSVSLRTPGELASAVVVDFDKFFEGSS